MSRRFPPTLSRRAFAGGALALAGLAATRGGRSATPPFERHFLFLYAQGGWDPTGAFDPHVGAAGVDMDADAVESAIGGITFTGGPSRPKLTRFVERWSPVTCFVNGLDAHTVGHDTGVETSLTGSGGGDGPDWGTLIAASSRQDYPIPHALLSGPAFTGGRSDIAMRNGGGALLTLLDHSLVGALDVPGSPFLDASERLIDAYLGERAAGFAAAHPSGAGGRRAAAYQSSLEAAVELQNRTFGLNFGATDKTTLAQCLAAAELFRLGLSRCAMVAIEGSWDTHTGNALQGGMLDTFFGTLDTVLTTLANTRGRQTETMLQEVTVVALSDFGRTPTRNAAGGKDHWPYGSAMLCGAGVAGGQRVGQTDDALLSQPIDLETGQADAAGDIPGVENLGAAILALGGIDPEDWLPGVQPLRAVIG
jgi:hypothetical protein